MTDAVERIRASLWPSDDAVAIVKCGDLRELLALAAPSEKDAELIAKLRAMSCNYASGHYFDELDSKTVAEAADRLATLTGPGEATDLLRRLEPHLDAIICYASTMGEHEPNRLAHDVRAFLQSSSPPPKEAK